MKYSCPFCYKTMPEGYVPSAWACCGEVGHAVAMASDTPRTDRIEAVCRGDGEKDQLYMLARKLERELNASLIAAGVASLERGEWAEERFVLLARLKACRGD